MKALESLPELLDHVKKIESLKDKFYEYIIDQYKRKQEHYSNVQQMQKILDCYMHKNMASIFNIDGTDCCGRISHD